MAYGDLRGNIAPCGCDPETDLGGIRRIGTIIKDYHSRSPHLEVLSLGNNPPESGEPLKLRTMLAFEKAVGAQAILWNHIDQQHFSKIKMLWSAEPSLQIPYVLSTSSRPKGVSYTRTIGDHKIFGYVSVDGKAPPLKEWRSKAKEQDWLLFSGTDSDQKLIQDAKIFSKIILSNRKPFGQDPDLTEKNEPGRLLQSGSYMIPSFGQGVLRSTNLVPRTIHLEQDKPSIMGMTFQAISPFQWLDKSYDRESLSDKVMAQYETGASHLFQTLAKARRKLLEKTPFATARSCKTCHRKAYKIWQKTAHASAYETLRQKNKHQDPECVTCHVLGYEVDGGFADEASSPHFVGVQCETCHGQALEHSRNPTKFKPMIKTAKNQCGQCHKTPHSSNFQFNAYWPKIKHGAPSSD